MLKDTLNKGISAPIAIGIVLILVVIVGSFTWLQYGEMWRETSELPEVEIPVKCDSIIQEYKSYIDSHINQFTSCEESSCVMVDGPEVSGGELCISDKVDLSKIKDYVRKYKNNKCGGPQLHVSYLACICEEGLCTFVDPEILDWKTYRNEEYGFEIKYPEKWLVIREDFGSPHSELVKNQVEPLDRVDFYSEDLKQLITIEVHNNSKEYTLEEWLETCLKVSGKINPIGVSFDWKEDFSLAGAKGLKGGFGYGTTFYQVAFLSEGNKVYRIKGGVRSSETGLYEYETVFNQMLSTFKFIEVQITEIKANFIYLTNGEYNGNLGGRLGADEKCISLPELSCKPETIHAFITVDKDDSIINMAENYKLDKNLPVYWFNRTSKEAKNLADNWSKMISGGDFELSLEGTELVGMNFAWTGGKGTDEYLATCNQWTTNEGDYQTGAGPQGTFGGGDSLFSSSGWAGISFSRLCYNKHNLLCICEGDITQSLIK